MNLKQSFHIWNAVVLIVAMTTEARSETVPLSIKTIIQRVEKLNIDILQEREELKQSKSLLVYERSRHKPKIDLHASWNRRKTSEIIAAVNEEPVYNTIGPYTKSSAKLVAFSPIWDPVIRQNIKTAENRLRIQELTLEQSSQEHLAAAIQLYFLYIKESDKLKALEQAVQRDRELLRLASSLYKAGASDKIDLIRAELKLYDDQEASLETSIKLGSLELQLKQALNISLAETIAPFSEEFFLCKEFSNTNDIIDQALRNRADYQRSLIEIEKSRTKHKAVKRGRLPSLSFHGEYEINKQDIDSSRGSRNWKAMFLMTVPLFDSKRTHSLKETALSKLHASLLEKEQIETETSHRIVDAVKRIQMLNRKTSISHSKYKLAKERYRLSKLRFEEGVADNQEAVEAALQLVMHDINNANTRYLYRRSLLEICFAQGEVKGLLDFIL